MANKKNSTAAASSDTAAVDDLPPLEDAPPASPAAAAAPAAVETVAAVVETTVAPAETKAPVVETAQVLVAGAFNSAPLYAAVSSFGANLEVEAERVANEAIASIDAKFHSPELVNAVREATHKLAIASAGRIGASEEQIAELAKMRDEAITVIQAYEHHAALSLEETIVKGIHRMYAQVQDLASGHLSDVVKHLNFLERLPMAHAVASAVRHLLAA